MTSSQRIDLKLLQRHVAAMLGVDTTTVSNWERNRCQPRLYLFPKVISFSDAVLSPQLRNLLLIEAIKTYRLMHGLNQKKMAKLLRIDPTTLARWEKGETKPSRKPSQRLVELINR